MAGGYVTGLGQSVVANIVVSAVCAVCVAIGWSQTEQFENPKNWPIWAGLIIAFGFMGFVGTVANAVRLWWKMIDRAPGDRFTVILADLVGDDFSRGQKQNVRDSLERYLGASIDIIAYPQVLEIGEGHVDSERANTNATAQKLLKDKRGDLLIWGRVKSAEAPSTW